MNLVKSYLVLRSSNIYVPLIEFGPSLEKVARLPDERPQVFWRYICTLKLYLLGDSGSGYQPMTNLVPSLEWLPFDTRADKYYYICYSMR
jgi:hypothetical protein